MSIEKPYAAERFESHDTVSSIIEKRLFGMRSRIVNPEGEFLATHCTYKVVVADRDPDGTPFCQIGVSNDRNETFTMAIDQDNRRLIDEFGNRWPLGADEIRDLVGSAIDADI